jgi:hypothetical protein
VYARVKPSVAVTVYIACVEKSFATPDTGLTLAPLWMMVGTSVVRSVPYGTIAVISSVAVAMLPTTPRLEKPKAEMALAVFELGAEVEVEVELEFGVDVKYVRRSHAGAVGFVQPRRTSPVTMMRNREIHRRCIIIWDLHGKPVHRNVAINEP